MTSAGPNRDLPREGEVLLVVPPFYDVTTPSLAVHLLQARARADGFHVSVLYANILLAVLLGVEDYTQVSFPKHYPPYALLGEWLLKRKAYGEQVLGDRSGPVTDLARAFGPAWARWMAMSRVCSPKTEAPSVPALRQMEAQVARWVDDLAGAIAHRGFGIVGCSTTFASIWAI